MLSIELNTYYESTFKRTVNTEHIEEYLREMVVASAEQQQKWKQRNYVQVQKL